MNPFMLISWMVTREIVDGSVCISIHEGISREEALTLWTIGSAYSQFYEDKLGSIEPGKFTELVVLSDDILTTRRENKRSLF